MISFVAYFASKLVSLKELKAVTLRFKTLGAQHSMLWSYSKGP